MTETTPSPLNNVITIDDERIKNHLDRVVRGSVEETLNALLEAEADRLCNAQRYERTQARRDTRAGHYERKLQTKAGEVKLKVPKLRMQPFETAIIERYRRRESSVEEALIEMCRVEDITEALWGTHRHRHARRSSVRRRSDGLIVHSADRSATQGVTSSGRAGGAATTTSSVTPASASEGNRAGLGSFSATATLRSSSERPCSRHAAARAPRRSATSAPGRLKPYQPSP